MDYAQYIPVQVIATMLGIPPEDGDQFRTWVHELLEHAPTNIEVAGLNLFQLFQYFGEHMERIRARAAAGTTMPGDDLISFLVAQAHDVIGRELNQDELFGMCLLLLLAGIDTTWSAIGGRYGISPAIPTINGGCARNPTCGRWRSRNCCAPTRR